MDRRLEDGVEEILTDRTTTGAGAAFPTANVNMVSFHVSGKTTAGAGAATVKIQVSNDGLVWLDLATVTLTLSTTATSDGFATQAPWVFTRANVTALSGTGASVSVVMGV